MISIEENDFQSSFESFVSEIKEQSITETRLKELLDQGIIWNAQNSDEVAASMASFPSEKIAGISAAHRPGLTTEITKTQNLNTAPFGVTEIDEQLSYGGLPFGHIHEWFCDKTDADKKAGITIAPPFSIFTSLIKNSLRKRGIIIWIGRRCWPTPYAIQDLQASSVFVDPPNERLKLWAFQTALRSRAAIAVITDAKKLSFANTRALELSARNGDSLGFIMREATVAATTHSAAYSKWLVSPIPSKSLYPRWRLTLLKIKGKQTIDTSWEIETAATKEIIYKGENRAVNKDRLRARVA